MTVNYQEILKPGYVVELRDESRATITEIMHKSPTFPIVGKGSDGKPMSWTKHGERFTTGRDATDIVKVIGGIVAEVDSPAPMMFDYLELTSPGDKVKLRNGFIAKVLVSEPSTSAYPLRLMLGDGKIIGCQADGKYVGTSGEHPLDVISIYCRAEPAEPVPILTDTPAHEMTMQDVTAAMNQSTPFTVNKVYLSGPMTGLPEHNYPEFHRVAAILRFMGVEVYNPAEYPDQGKPEFPLREAFTDYVRFILNEADALVVLPGWETSKGVAAEKALAEVIGIPIIFY